jgi:tRNA-Thr(GGU) m(6)t(6)A37 methyltransferase TsaA
VRNDIKTARPHGWDDVRSTIVVREDLAPGLDGIEDFSHLIVVFAFDKVPEGEQRLRIEGEPAGAPERGVLATRSQRRPSPIGVSVARLQRRRGNVLWVTGLDAIHGTPVLDIKPYYPGHDSIGEARVPEWARPVGGA